MVPSMLQTDSPMPKQGSLTCVGSGIKGIAQLTLEAVDWIRHADVVCYCCPDPATVVWIRQNAKAQLDLGAFYADGRHRLETYTLMTACLLSLVREGKAVCAVFYGHPGLFVYPTHRACAAAKAEGYAVRMLPGISAADCLFADLGFDPSQAGCVMYEATDMLLRRRPLLADSHVIIWQVGVVGEAQWQAAGHTNRYAGYLIDYLLETYEATHKVFHYQGTQYPMLPSVIQRLELGRVERECRFTTTSTTHSSREPRAMDQRLAEALRIFGPKAEGVVASPPRWSRRRPRARRPRSWSELTGELHQPLGSAGALTSFWPIVTHAIRVTALERRRCQPGPRAHPGGNHGAARPRPMRRTSSDKCCNPASASPDAGGSAISGRRLNADDPALHWAGASTRRCSRWSEPCCSAAAIRG